MATNSLTHLPFEVESDVPRPAIWTGLSDLLVNNRSEEVGGLSRFFGTLALWSRFSEHSSHHAMRGTCHVGRTHESVLVTASAEPILQVTPAQVTCEWRILQMIPAPSHLSLTQQLGLSSSPRYCGAKTSHPCCALTEFLTRRVCEHKVAVVSCH